MASAKAMARMDCNKNLRAAPGLRPTAVAAASTNQAHANSRTRRGKADVRRLPPIAACASSSVTSENVNICTPLSSFFVPRSR